MKKSAIIRIIIWSIVLVLLLGILAAGLGYRSFRRYTNRNLWNSTAATAPLEGNMASSVNSAAKENTDVHSSPNTQSSIEGVINAGEEITIERTESINGQQWAYVSSPISGWIQTESLDTPDSYSVPADQVEKISVDWVSGEITVKSAEVEEISFYESGSSRYPMVWKLKDNKLDIDYCEDNLHFGLFNIDDKDLTILVPKDWTCDELELDTASTALRVSDMTIREVEVDSASGICRFQNCNIMDLDVDTASGDVYLEGSLNTLDFDAASAKFTGVLYNTPSRMKVDSMSGDLDLTLPEDTGFTVKMDGMNNGFTSDFPTTMRNNSHVCGDGRCFIEVDGMSSDVTIRRSDSLPVTEALPTESSETKSLLPSAAEVPTAPDVPTVSSQNHHEEEPHEAEHHP